MDLIRSPKEQEEAKMSNFASRIATLFRSSFGRGRSWPAAIFSAAGCLLLLLQAVPPAYAEDPSFGEPRLFGTGSDSTTSLAVGDLNGDGALDIVVANRGWPDYEQNVAYLNDGRGNYDWPGSARPVGPEEDPSTSIALGDMDGDGDLDVVIGNSETQNVVYFNDGAGSFPDSTPFGLAMGATNGIAVADMDGDADLDVIVGNSGQNFVYLNDGTGSFSQFKLFGTGSDPTTIAVSGDVNDDGDLDIVCGNFLMQNVVYLNDGAGNFVLPHPFGTGSDVTADVDLGDMDGDGDLDIVTGNTGAAFPGSGEQNVIYLNDGSGNFVASLDFGTGWDWTSSVRVADLDGDGDLDVAVGNSDVGNAENQNAVYLNDGSGDLSNAHDVGPGTDQTEGLAIADVDDNGALDFIAGNYRQTNVAFLNDGAGTYASADDFGGQFTAKVAVGDVDKDSDLDLIAGNGGPNEIHLNDGTGDFAVSLPFGPSSDDTWSLAVGDLDGDTDLDIAVGNLGEQNVVYLNDGAGYFYTGTVDCTAPPPNATCFGTGTDNTMSLALGDLDGDGDLDIAAGNGLMVGEQNVVYLNDGAAGFDVAHDFGTGSDRTRSLALGDLDRDGDLDIVVGNQIEPNIVYMNDGTGDFGAARSFGPESDNTWGVAVGDMTGDGYLDIVVGNNYEQNSVYVNDGGATFPQSYDFGTGLESTESVALGDVDNDGDLDIFVGNGAQFEVGEQNVVYLNNGQGQFDWASPVRELEGYGDYWWTETVATGDLNNDGTLDLVIGNGGDWIGGVNHVYLNHARLPERLFNIPPHLFVNRPGLTANANHYASAEILEDPAIPITYTLFDAESDPIDHIFVSFSPDGGGDWLPAIAAGGTITTNLATSPGGTNHVFVWDVFESGFFGQSDNVVLRIQAYPSLLPQSDAGAGPYQWPYAAGSTFPFRVRGTQVRVLSGTLPISNAMVYRLPAGQLWGEAIADGAGRPFRTNARGYLQGRGQLDVGDGLVALLPITSTDTYTLCFSSAAPTLLGVNPYTVTTPGVQTLTVSPGNPFLLLNLDVSLEWDARNDDAFMEQLIFDLQRTSDFLYDWTDGQAALGEVTVYHDRENWLDAHVRVYASNHVRPSAAQGGILSDFLTDTDVLSITYAPGQVHMGATWNRYGDPGGSIGEDWPRTLAHELGHYAFFLDDNYMGLDEDGLLIPVEGCPGAMADPYRQDYPYDEYHPAQGWLPACEQTLSHQATGRSDWETIVTFYPWLSAYATITNTGPAGLPLAVTQIEVIEAVTPPTTLEDPTFYLSQNGESVQPGNSTRAFLFQGLGGVTAHLSDLGRPVLDYVVARGARPGERLCVYELAEGRLGCEIISEGDEQLELVAVPDWQPDLAITPINSTTIAISVTNVPAGEPFWARLYPLNDPAIAPISLTETGTGYTGTLQAEVPVMAGYVHVWVEGSSPEREVVTDYALGGNPGTIRGRLGTIRGRLGTIRGRLAPAVSADGQVIIFGENLDFEKGEFFTLQPATVLPDPLPWATNIGQGYRLSASPNAPDLTQTSISFSYMGSEVPPGEEEWVRAYHWNGSDWQRLPTSVDVYRNSASAPVQGEGLYLLMSSLEIPLQQGWNILAYPVNETRSVTETLLSIDGAYSLVYHYDATEPADPWRVYGVNAPGWVNDLTSFAFGQGYWISTTQAITLYLKGGGGYQALELVSFPNPPATYYGAVLSSPSFTPTVGMTVSALVNGYDCGQAQTRDIGGQVVYVLSVLADDQVDGCGDPGQTVSFLVNTQPMAPTVLWNNGRLRELPLSPVQVFDYTIYLPIILRND
jgi:hypothetical protein